MKQALIMIIKRKALKTNKSVHKMWKMGEIATPPPPEKTLSPSPFTFVWYLDDKKNFFFYIDDICYPWGLPKMKLVLSFLASSFSLLL